MWEFVLNTILYVIEYAFSFTFDVITWPLSWLFDQLGMPDALPDWVVNIWQVFLRFVDVFVPYGNFVACLKAIVTVEFYVFAGKVMWWVIQNIIIPALSAVKSWAGSIVSWFTG